jgi:hypothetical protein
MAPVRQGFSSNPGDMARFSIPEKFVTFVALVDFEKAQLVAVQNI